MNERIRELAEQAAKKHGHTIKFSPEITETLDSFAELIVQECADVVERNLFQNIGYNTSRAVKQHFGMEDEE